MSEAEIESGPGYLVKRVQQSLRRRCDAALKPTGLSMAQYTVLRALDDHPDAAAAQLARLCFVTRQAVHDVLQILHSSGLIQYTAASERGRARPLHLTGLGIARLGASDTAMSGAEAVMLDGITPPQRARLAHLLRQCAENLEAAEPSRTATAPDTPTTIDPHPAGATR